MTYGNDNQPLNLQVSNKGSKGKGALHKHVKAPPPPCPVADDGISTDCTARGINEPHVCWWCCRRSSRALHQLVLWKIILYCRDLVVLQRQASMYALYTMYTKAIEIPALYCNCTVYIFHNTLLSYVSNAVSVWIKFTLARCSSFDCGNILKLTSWSGSHHYYFLT